jgi:hypothetical protein
MFLFVNPMTGIFFNASAEKISYATSSLVHFLNKNIFFYFEKRPTLLQR